MSTAREVSIPKKTKGQLRVGVDFNPSGMPEVDQYKAAASTAVDGLEPLVAQGGELGRCASIAQTKFQEASMWAVRAFTMIREVEIEE